MSTAEDAAASEGGSEQASLPPFSPRWHRYFLVYLRRYFGKSFSAVRISRQGRAPDPGTRPLIVYANHPSWWDPIHFTLMASLELPQRRVYGPLEAKALAKYRFFEKLGGFGVEQSPRGLRHFLRTSEAILARPDASLWLTPEGEFADPRRRPLRLRPGLSMLARRLEDALVVPLAVEYPFWDERLPEAVTRFGTPIDIAAEPRHSVRQWTQLFETRLEETMAALALDVETRDPDRFRTLLAGRVGIGGIYDQWRRWKALASGKEFHAAHGDKVS